MWNLIFYILSPYAFIQFINNNFSYIIASSAYILNSRSKRPYLCLTSNHIFVTYSYFSQTLENVLIFYIDQCFSYITKSNQRFLCFVPIIRHNVRAASLLPLPLLKSNWSNKFKFFSPVILYIIHANSFDAWAVYLILWKICR